MPPPRKFDTKTKAPARKGENQFVGVSFLPDAQSGRNVHEFYDLEKTNPLGVGGFGTVLKGMEKKSKKNWAVKTMAKSTIKNPKQVKDEIMCMQSLKHPNIVALHDCFEDDDCLYLVMEMCSGGAVFDVIQPPSRVPEKVAARMSRQVLGSIAYLHSQGIAHRDMKPENIMFASRDKDSPVKIKLIDFGLGCKFHPGDRMKTKVGSLYYVSPQVLKGDYTEKCDVWSIGVIT